MCQVLGVSRSCYYHWLRVEKQDDTELNDIIEGVFVGSRQTYGTRRMKKQLERLYGLIISRRRIVGWSMDAHMTATLVNDALFMALKKRTPDHGLIWHTDRGSQYASDSHKELLKEYGIIQSMSRRGNCYDNAVAESFFHSLKTELTHHMKFETRSQANQAIFEYIEVFYNRQRLHSSNNYMSPVDFEKQLLLNEMSA